MLKSTRSPLGRDGRRPRVVLCLTQCTEPPFSQGVLDYHGQKLGSCSKQSTHSHDPSRSQIAQASLCAFNLHLSLAACAAAENQALVEPGLTPFLPSDADAKCTSTQLPSPIYGQLEDLSISHSYRRGTETRFWICLVLAPSAASVVHCPAGLATGPKRWDPKRKKTLLSSACNRPALDSSQQEKVGYFFSTLPAPGCMNSALHPECCRIRPSTDTAGQPWHHLKSSAARSRTLADHHRPLSR